MFKVMKKKKGETLRALSGSTCLFLLPSGRNRFANSSPSRPSVILATNSSCVRNTSCVYNAIRFVVWETWIFFTEKYAYKYRLQFALIKAPLQRRNTPVNFTSLPFSKSAFRWPDGNTFFFEFLIHVRGSYSSLRFMTDLISRRWDLWLRQWSEVRPYLTVILSHGYPKSSGWWRFSAPNRVLQINLVQPTVPVVEIIFMPVCLAPRTRGLRR